MRPGAVLFWNISFVGSLRTLLHAQTPTPLQDTTFGVIVGNTTQPAAYGFVGLESINVAVNGQRFLVYHTDQCCWEAIGLLHNIDITASMGFEVTIQTGVANDTYYLAAFVGGE